MTKTLLLTRISPVLLLGVTGCFTTPEQTPTGLAQWYPQGQVSHAASAPAGAMAPANTQAPAHTGAPAKLQPKLQPKPPETARPTRPAYSSQPDDAAGISPLALAKMRLRIKDLEEKYRKLWLKYQALEKGLTLGLVTPEVAASLSRNLDNNPMTLPQNKAVGSMGDGDGSASHSGASPSSKPSARHKDSTVKHTVVDLPIISAVHAPKSKSLSSGIKDALALYKSAKYGKALLAFQGLQKQYSPAQLKGNDHYWIALCWYRLKDFSKARESLNIFQSRYSGHNLARKAALYQAKIDIDVGLTKKGVAALEELVRQKSTDEVAKLALSEIESVNDIFR